MLKFEWRSMDTSGAMFEAEQDICEPPKSELQVFLLDRYLKSIGLRAFLQLDSYGLILDFVACTLILGPYL